MKISQSTIISFLTMADTDDDGLTKGPEAGLEAVAPAVVGHRICVRQREGEASTGQQCQTQSFSPSEESLGLE